MTTPTKDLTVSEYMRLPDQKEKFTNILGLDADAYIQSVLLAVANSDDLMKCTHNSVVRSALRAASLGLSCDPALKQAWLVPYPRKMKRKNNQGATEEYWIQEAQFQPHYLGLRSLAMRTGKYWTINVSPVYDGQRVFENPLTGLHVVVEGNGFVGEPKAYNPGLVDVTNRRRKDMKVIGWIAYYKSKNGEEKSVYMSCEEIDDWARQFVKGYLDDKGNVKNPNWKDPNKRPTMEMKTVLRRLLDWTDKSGKAGEQLANALKADSEPESEVVDAASEDVPTVEVTAPDPDTHPMNIDEARQTIGIINGKEKPLGNCTSDELNYVYLNSLRSNAVEAARIILVEDFRMTPPQTEKKTTEQLQKELGF